MAPPLRILLDTNVYGMLVEANASTELLQFIEDGKILVFGFSVIRKELRAISKDKQIEGKNYRGYILSFYDRTTQNRNYAIDERVEELAKKYAGLYRGGISTHRLMNDFRIVACASIHGLDILVTGDSHSMCSALAKEAYQKANDENEFRTPAFCSFNELEKIF